MNLGGLFSGFGNSTDGIFGKNSRTLIIILIIIIVIFGFGFGRGIFGIGRTGGGFAGGYQGYGTYPPNAMPFGGLSEYGLYDPERGSKRRKHKHSHSRYGKFGGSGLGLEYGYGYGYGTPGYGGYGGYGLYPGYGRGRGGLFGNDWFFIIAVIALLFLLGEDNTKTETANNDINI